MPDDARPVTGALSRRTSAAAAQRTLTGWGRVPVVPGEERRSEDLAGLTVRAALSRGLGRAYGDAALPASSDYRLAGTTLADRLLSFDPESGVLTAEAGVALDDIYRVLLPRGYFTPVTPGTRFVTLGGMIASDVHGKNHHRDGTFGRHVRSITLRVGTGDVVTCSPHRHADLFRATIGGMGLTGHILEASVVLTPVPSPWLVEERIRVPHVTELAAALDETGVTWPMTVGWVDCAARGRRMGRGVLYRGRWAEPGEARSGVPPLSTPRTVPVLCPEFLLTTPAVRAFNAINYGLHRGRAIRRVVSPEQFFYPLDAVGQWHRLYGRRGFIQYQCVLPRAAGPGAARLILDVLARHRALVPLCVVKDCGAEGPGLLSFPMPGMSIALDIPMGDDTQRLVDALNEQVIAAGGRIYLAKDALTRPEHFRRMEPRLDEFLRIRRAWDPQGRIRSAQSMRLFGW
jgi:decaprenylphospho-beta-D-ribofuranose 2-oxidase